ncbi:MAG: DUF6901 family protein [Endomicrobiales bacterium]
MESAGNNDPVLSYLYRFNLPGGSTKEFTVTLDRKTLNLVAEKKTEYPAWVKLEHFKCKNCPLDAQTHPYCPVAANIGDIVEFFRSSVSYEQVDITIESAKRSYSRRAPLEDGISSLIGIYMATSGCPVMEKLKPMVRYHLPFATTDETRYRVISMYLLAQHFIYKKGGRPDWELKELSRMYNEVRVVNKSFSERLVNATTNDASVNALVKLDSFALHVSFTIDKNAVDDMAGLFKAFVREP